LGYGRRTAQEEAEGISFVLDNVKMLERYFFGLPHFLTSTVSLDESRRMVTEQLRNRERSFLTLIQIAVYHYSASPYRALLSNAGIDFPDIANLVQRDGLNATLERLHSEGVYLSYEEFKGRSVIRRGSFTHMVEPRDLDNPLLAKHYVARTGASRGAGTRIIIDFDLLTHEAAYYDLFETAFRQRERPLALWHPLPPAVSGIKQALRIAKLGRPIERWFSKNRFSPGFATLHYFLFSAWAIYGSRLTRNRLPMPEHVPLDRALAVARWLAEKKKERRPAILLTGATSAVRVCRAALEQDLDIAGSFFRVGGEPFSEAKAQMIGKAGCQAVSHYSMAELGNIGEPCARANDVDDLHLLEDKIGILQRPKRIGASGVSVGALFYTTLLPSSPKIMLNVESDDYGILEDRRCGCLIEELGLRRHLRQIRSYDKLTSEGMTFFGGELIRLVEKLLPEQFGGYPTDYQLVEEEDAGIPRVQVRVSPQLGGVNEGEILETVLRFLGSHPGAKKMMAAIWRQADTLRVVREEPCVTAAGKILPLHILRRTSEP
jgi:hypothetical protein